VFSGTIGRGLFDDSGEILRVAGPVGGLVTYIIVGFGVICVIEGLAEMIGHWPIANAMVEFVKAFVDKDLAVVVGIAYWRVATSPNRILMLI
jgi:amino acid transporter